MELILIFVLVVLVVIAIEKEKKSRAKRAMEDYAEKKLEEYKSSQSKKKSRRAKNEHNS